MATLIDDDLVTPVIIAGFRTYLDSILKVLALISELTNQRHFLNE